MPGMLHVIASPRGSESCSITVATAFVDAFRRRHADWGYQQLNVFDEPLTDFAAPQAAAKYAVMSGQEPKDSAARAWKSVIEMINRLKSAQLLLISSPMWNFSIPYRLKQFIDIIVQPGLTFTYSPREGYKGLLTHMRAVLVLARGGAYGPGSGAEDYDMQKAYLETVLKFIGISDIRNVIIEKTLQSNPEQLSKNLSAAIAGARGLADEI